MRGKVRFSHYQTEKHKDHPRLCGEKERLIPMPTVVVGITPAYAGKRTARFIRKTPFWDHPRLCGEKLATRKSAAAALGSPPPMRGKVGMGVDESEKMGITPAYAGKRAE